MKPVKIKPSDPDCLPIRISKCSTTSKKNPKRTSLDKYPKIQPVLLDRAVGCRIESAVIILREERKGFEVEITQKPSHVPGGMELRPNSVRLYIKINFRMISCNLSKQCTGGGG